MSASAFPGRFALLSHVLTAKEQGDGRPRHRGRQRRRHRGPRNGHSQVDQVRRRSRSAPASSARARSPTPDALGEALKELFAEHKLSKNVRLGIANQRVAVRTPAAAGDRGQAGARDRDPLPGPGPHPDAARAGGARLAGRRPRHRRGRRPRRSTSSPSPPAATCSASLMEAIATAGLKPTGIDLSAFGMIRALAREAYPGSAPATSSAPRTPAAAPTRSGSQPARRCR